MGGGADDSSALMSDPAMAELQARIDKLGFGGFQLLALICTGGVMMSEGAEMLLMGCMTKMLDKEWGLADFTKGFMVSVVFAGFAVGNLLSGKLGDTYGRRPTILLSYLIMGTAGLLTATANCAPVMICLRMMVGVGCGIGFPSIYTLIPELCPTKLRGAVCACMIGFMPLGEMYAALGVIAIDKDLTGRTTFGAKWHVTNETWRVLCDWGAVPAFIFLAWCLVLLPESPFFLAKQGRHEEANAVLASMAYWNGGQTPEGIAPVAIPAAAPPPRPVDSSGKGEADKFSWREAVQRCLSGRYMETTLVMFCAHFTKDFSVFGLSYVFPQYFKELAFSVEVGWEIFITAMLTLPGVFIAMGLTRWESFGNIAALKASAFLAGLLCLGLLEGAPRILHTLCAPTLKSVAMIYFIIVVTYTAEVFPTSIRNSAVGLCTCAGRAGSISAPLVFELASSFNIFWGVLVTCMWGIVALARTFLTMETKGRPLEDGGSAPAGKALKGAGACA